MNIRVAIWTLVATTLFLLSPTDSSAQFGIGGQNGAIGGRGTSVVKQTPDFMRMYIQISATGKSLKEALTKLEESREAALKQLGDLGVDKESIKIDGPRPATLSSEQQQMMQMVMRQRNRGARRNPSEAPKTSTVSLNVTADWPLQGTTTEALLIESDALQTKIKAANIAQVGEEELSPEEQELHEEMAEMASNYGQDPAEQPGTPSFVFGKKLAGDTLATATKEAFDKAKENAVLLSQAAGMELGPLQQLASQAELNNQNDPYSVSNYRYYGASMQQSQSDESNEALGSDVSNVQVTVQVYASFGLKE